MTMVPLIRVGVCLLILTVPAMLTADEIDSPLDKAASSEVAVHEVLIRYLAAYNAHDADALAAHWKEEGVFVDESAGDKLAGREAIRNDFIKLFDENQDVSLDGNLDTIRFIRPDVCEIQGSTITTRSTGFSVNSNFTGIMVLDDNCWRIDSLHETLVPLPTKSENSLKSLEFLVGSWIDDTADAQVVTTARWGMGNAFLIRSYKIAVEDAMDYQGTQIIGWDPRFQQIRCWTFDSDGSFGEGVLSPAENGWVMKIRQTLTDGRIAGGAQVITQIDHNTLTIQSLDQEVDGDAIPASDPVRVIRTDNRLDD